MRRTIGALIAVSVLCSCTLSDKPELVDPMAERPTSAPEPGGRDRHPTWAIRSNERLSIRIGVPPRWSFRWNPLRDGTVGDVLVAGSWRFAELPECAPIPPGQALVTLSEVPPLVASLDYPSRRLERSFPPRSGRFETTVLRSLGVRKGCDQPKAQLFRFGEAGRFLYAWMMFGRDLSTGMRTKAEAVLSTVEVVSRD